MCIRDRPYKNLRKAGHYEHRWETPSFKKQGMYRAELLTLNKDSDVINRNHISLAVLRKREVNAVDPSNKFGVNITDLREFWALERIGIGWSRFTFNCSMSDLMFSKGVWNHQHEKRLSALLERRRSTAFILSCLLYTSPSPRDPSISRMPSSA